MHYRLITILVRDGSLVLSKCNFTKYNFSAGERMMVNDANVAT